jgi:hypothetical protein
VLGHREFDIDLAGDSGQLTAEGALPSLVRSAFQITAHIILPTGVVTARSGTSWVRHMSRMHPRRPVARPADWLRGWRSVPVHLKRTLFSLLRRPRGWLDVHEGYDHRCDLDEWPDHSRDRPVSELADGLRERCGN